MLTFKFNFKSALFRRTLFSYFLMIIFLMLATSFIYTTTANQYRTDLINNNLNNLENAKSIVDVKVDGVFSMVNQLTSTNTFFDMLQTSSAINATTLYNLRNNYTEVKNLTSTNKMIKNVFMIYNKSGLIVGNESTYRKDFFYEKVFKYDNLGEDEWKKNILRKRHFNEITKAMPIEYNGIKKNYITFLNSYPVESENPQCVVIALIDEMEIHKILGKGYSNSQVYSLITNAKNEVITATTANVDEKILSAIPTLKDNGSKEIKIEKEQYNLSRISSNFNNWNYISVVPLAYVFHNLNKLNNLLMGILIVFFIFGILIAIYFSISTFKPIDKIISQIGGNKEDKKNEFEIIGDALSNLIKNNKDLNEDLQKNIQKLRDDFYYRVLKGNFTTSQEIANNMKSLDMEMLCNQICSVVLKIDSFYSKNINEINYSELVTVKTIIVNAINENCDNLKLCDTDNDEITLILFETNSNFSEYVHSLCENILQILRGQYNIGVSVAIGGIYKEYIGMFYSYNEACEIVNYFKVTDYNGILDYSEHKDKKSFYYFPLSLEQNIINLTKSGEKDELIQLFDNLYYQNIEKRDLTLESIYQLKNNMQSTLIRLIDNLFIGDEQGIKNAIQMIEILKTKVSMTEYFIEAKQIFINLAELMHTRKRSHNQKLRDNMVDYVNIHFKEYNLTVKFLSENFSISEAYLSRFFKEQTGQTFSDYLEQLRIEEAKQLLGTKGMNINDIASHLGYVNSQVFRRAFKRRTGVTPSDYKID